MFERFFMDFLGGCNGARIRHSPQKDQPVNKNINKALDLLNPIKESHGPNLTWADLIILAGNTAMEKAGGTTLHFVGVVQTQQMDLALNFCPPRYPEISLKPLYSFRTIFLSVGSAREVS